MAINLNAFNQQMPQVNLAQSFREGTAAVGDMYGARRQKQALIADQFANQQAPILAQQKAQAFEQDILNAQQSRANVADVMKYRDIENKQKTADYIGGAFASVQTPEDLDRVGQHLMNNPALDKDVLTHSLGFFKDPNNRTVEAAQQFGMGTLKAVEQAQLRFNAFKQQQSALEAAEQAKFKAQEAQRQFDFDRLKYGLEEAKLREAQRHNKAIENKPSSAPSVILQTDSGALLVNKKTGETKEILGVGGQSIIKDKSGKPLSAEAAQRVSLSKGFEDNINELVKKMTDGSFLLNSLSARIPGSDLSRLRKDTMDQLAKLRSGAATGSKEEVIYTDLISSFGDLSLDNKESFLNQMSRFKKQNKYFMDALLGNADNKEKPVIREF